MEVRFLTRLVAVQLQEPGIRTVIYNTSSLNEMHVKITKIPSKLVQILPDQHSTALKKPCIRRIDLISQARKMIPET